MDTLIAPKIGRSLLPTTANLIIGSTKSIVTTKIININSTISNTIIITVTTNINNTLFVLLSDADSDEVETDADADADEIETDADVAADADDPATGAADDEVEAQQAGPEMDTRICRDRPAASAAPRRIIIPRKNHSKQPRPTQPSPSQYFALHPFSSSLTSSGWWWWRCP